MSTYRRYFRVTSGPLVDAFMAASEKRRAAHAAALAFAQKHGASGATEFNHGRIAGFTFDKPPEARLWKKAPGGWVPKRTPAAKALRAEFDALPKAGSHQDALAAVGLRPNCPAMIDGRNGLCAGVGGFPQERIFFVQVPWRDVDPKEMDQYRADRAAGVRYSMELDHLLWAPPPELVEVKQWEYLRESEELSAKAAANPA